MSKKKKKKIEIVNKKASFEYFLRDHYEAGICLRGTEVKSIRSGHVSLTDAYCSFERGELYVYNLYIKEYDHSTYFNHKARRTRKLLLRKTEIKKLLKKVKEKGFTIVPYKMYISDRGFVKLEIAVAEGKKGFNKKESIKAKDQKRELERMRRDKY